MVLAKGDDDEGLPVTTRSLARAATLSLLPHCLTLAKLARTIRQHVQQVRRVPSPPLHLLELTSFEHCASVRSCWPAVALNTTEV